MPDDFPDVRKLLDAVPSPNPKLVNLAALYRAAAERQAIVSRRWRRITLAGAAPAAGVLVVALLPRLEFRVSGHEFAVRWGVPPKCRHLFHRLPHPTPASSSCWKNSRSNWPPFAPTNTKHAELQDLLLTLATDVSDRDKEQQARIAALTKKWTAFEADTARQFADAEKTNAALYDVVFNARKVKANP